jgi:alkylation response protein AidB-like acyl-CoA dehydrogenase
MNFTLSHSHRAWQSSAHAFARELPPSAAAPKVVTLAARAGLVSPQFDLLAAALAVEAVAWESAGAGITLALHIGAVSGLTGDARAAALVRGEIVGAIALSSEDVPAHENGRLSGRAAWVAPLTERALAIVGVRGRDGLEAAAVMLDGAGVTIEPVTAAALNGIVCGHVRFESAPVSVLGPTLPFMARVRVLLAAAGVGMGQRALHEALRVARGHTGHGAGGEQTVQGLLADAATELDAARLLTLKAASATTLSLAAASMAKLASTEATQRAVARATQIVGVDSFRSGHVIEQLAQDVRALELFAGRTEALREAVAAETL